MNFIDLMEIIEDILTPSGGGYEVVPEELINAIAESENVEIEDVEEFNKQLIDRVEKAKEEVDKEVRLEYENIE